MWPRFREQSSNWFCRIGLGLGIGTILIILALNHSAVDQNYYSLTFIAGAQAEEALPYNEESKGNEEGKVQVEPERLARENPLALLKLAQKSYRKSIKDYTCTFIKQERINGHLKDPEKISVHFKEAPFSLLMNWQKPKGQVAKLLYVEKDGNRTILIHPSGFAGALLNTVQVDVDNPKLKKSALLTPAQFGFARLLDDMVSTFEKADKKGDLVIECLDNKVLDGRKHLVLRRKLPMDKGYDTLFAVLYIYIDTEYLLPTKTEGYDTAGNLIGRYRYLDLRFNRGLTDKIFSPQANDLDD